MRQRFDTFLDTLYSMAYALNEHYLKNKIIVGYRINIHHWI